MQTAEPRYTVPSRKHLTTQLIQDKASQIEQNMRQRLAEARSVCVTVDMWTNRQIRSYLGMTGYFVDDWTLKSSILSCTRFNGRHTADNIYTHYDEIIRIFDIQKVSHIIPDSAANMIKAFSLLGFQPVVFNDISDESDADISESEAHSNFCLIVRTLRAQNRVPWAWNE